VKLSPQASWDQNGITVTGWENGTNGSSLSQLNLPLGISITSNDILYVSDTGNNRIVIVNLDSISNISIIDSASVAGPNQFSSPHDLFATSTLLYVIDLGNHRVQKMLINGANVTIESKLTGLNQPHYMYVDNNDNIYLSDPVNHTVLLFRSNVTNSSIIAGTGINGTNNTQLNHPYGVFVNSIGTLYIADCFNHRIMKWLYGATSGILVAGDGTPGSSSTQLNAPTDIVVDADEYMYISESSNSRITRWAPNSICGMCLVGCTGVSGTASTQLKGPHSLAFDSNGSLYVADRENHRVQKFQILNYPSEYFIN
jgi:hypothetical protein